MTTRMLIDARHREETRVAVVTGNRIEEFDFESAEHKQLKGNIYLAKVTRVEPSLQAAFVDYGGNRHGFLAFAEIHPDYYQIPKEDRERLLAEEAEAAAEEAALREQEEEESEEPSDIMQGSEEREDEVSDFIEIDSDDSVDTIDMSEGEEPDLSENGGDSNDENGRDETNARNNRRRRGRGGRNGGEGRAPKASDEVRAKRMNLRRRYKIQDVIHRRQVLLVQVVKEERGNKGAALTTYLSLAGRYCVLMPNTSHGGGISRKIHSAADRKRLKSIISDLTLPATMGCIIRTAGLARTKPEIKRDFDYLARLWDEIRERTLRGAAPMLIHTDSDLIKRAIRDIYNKDIEEVFVEGPEGYKAAKDFMKLLMPSHAKRVQHYADPVPLFQRYHVEDQLNAMYQPIVQLKSGGYIVINPTEALVSIDINSGRSTKEHGIEATALSTNLEAAREIARQLRLRDMAGLVVIDFIDMEHHGNARKVERAMKEALKHDRARIQVGRISGFGLMEMSRQRLRTGVLEASTRQCPHCEGTGLVRTASSAALSALRLIEEEAAKGNGNQIVLQASQEATIYCLNNKRGELADIEERYHVRVLIVPNGETEGAKLAVSSSGPRPEAPIALPPIIDIEEDDFDEEIDDFDAEEEEANEPRRAREDRPRDDSEGGEGRRRKRRRGRRGGKSRERDERGENADGQTDQADEPREDNAETPADATVASSDDAKPKARRGRRGGRGRGRTDADMSDAGVETVSATDNKAEEQPAPAPVADEPAAEKPKRRSRAKPKAEAEIVAVTDTAETAAPSEEKPAPKKRSRAKAANTDAKAAPAPAPEPVAEEAPVAKPKPGRKKAPAKAVKDEAVTEQPAENDGPARTGWWQRTFG
ncbi:Rne/Rng family ribonuclease [Sphingorhabdus sp. IMCC26285]|uniref:Ribonuclease E n=1 Tax=Sphingorhabdus profundilacus TaxID=2509718 RepID=A0A6I4LYX1_9SPHN|nr:ribonuclease E/G [Sphingorhabdus profundilacus]MVZ97180.1 Rne/Rng family ribonuclease [Sphingorhabdus profundilacus]